MAHGSARRLWICGIVLLPAAAATGCSTTYAPEDAPLAPLAAPAPSPPGDLSLEDRVLWWEQHLRNLSAGDRSEAHLRLGDLHLEAGHGREARLSFYSAMQGPLSRFEQARAERGIGLSYLLEDEPMAAVGHLDRALPDLTGPEQEEIAYLVAVHRGLAPPPPDAVMLARLQPYLPASATSLVPKTASTAGLLSIDRMAWSARPIRPNREPMEPPFRITVHHSAEPLLEASRWATISEVRHIQQMHFQRGWADIGYHFLIDRAGRVVEGRPMSYQGAHAGNGELNRGNIGICVLGNFEPQPDRGPEYTAAQSPTTEQLRSLERLVDSLRQEYGISRNQVYGHSDLRQTHCPGSLLLGWVRRYRAGAGLASRRLPDLP